MTQNGLALGIDFGTTHVKATLIDSPNLYPVRLLTRSWSELGLDRGFLCDWFLALDRIVVEVLASNGTTGNHEKEIRAIAVSATAPTVALADVDILMRGIDAAGISPIINYDEYVPDYGNDIQALDMRARKRRTEYVVAKLLPLTPSEQGGRIVVLSATGLLTWYLTGVVSIDRSSRYELGLLPDDNLVLDAHVPSVRMACDEVVAEIRQGLSERWKLRQDTRVAAGSSDTFALAVGGALSPRKGLVCLGTFFGLLETDEDMSRTRGYDAPGDPYRWHVSSPIGSTIERVASSWYPFESDTGRRIGLFLNAARESWHLRRGNEISYRPWRNNSSVRELPTVVRSEGTTSIGQVGLSLLTNFATALEEGVQGLALDELVVAGGLCRYEWLVSYIEKCSGLSFETKRRTWAAEGAAVLAARACVN